MRRIAKKEPQTKVNPRDRKPTTMADASPTKTEESIDEEFLKETLSLEKEIEKGWKEGADGQAQVLVLPEVSTTMLMIKMKGVQKRKENPKEWPTVPHHHHQGQTVTREEAKPRRGHLYSSIEEEKFGKNFVFEKSQEKTVPG